MNLSHLDIVVKQIKNSFVNIFTSCAVDALVGCQKISVTNEENSYTREKINKRSKRRKKMIFVLHETEFKKETKKNNKNSLSS